jgi:mannose-1-phosphate guanylyltransferase
VISKIEADGQGNKIEGDCVAVHTKDSVIVSKAPDHLVAVLGLEGYVVISTPKATFVCPKDRVNEIPALLEKMPSSK